MSATADTSKLGDYFGDFYGHPYNRHDPARVINIDKVSNYNIIYHYLDDLFGLIPAVSISICIHITKIQIIILMLIMFYS